MSRNTLDLLGLPFLDAKEKMQNLGYCIGRVTYTFAPDGQKIISPRVVRQIIVDCKKVDLVLADSPWI